MTDGEAVYELDPYRVSPSRVNSLLACGKEFEMYYIQKRAPERSGSAALFGSVVHKALEHWSHDRGVALLPLMKSAWHEVTEGTVLQEFVAAYERLSVEAIRVKHQIGIDFERRNGKPVKAVTMTNDWKNSNIKKRIDHLLADWQPRIEKDPATIWVFTERDPLPGLYDESLPLARRYEERWRHLQPTVHTEIEAEIRWLAWDFKCYIDAVEPLHDLALEALGQPGPHYLGITDYKTYSGLPTPMKDWRQCAMYYVAWKQMLERGLVELPPELAALPLKVGIDYVRWQDNSTWAGMPPRKYWTFTVADERRLEDELQKYSHMVREGIFLPAEKYRNADFCAYPSACCQKVGGPCEAEMTLL